MDRTILLHGALSISKQVNKEKLLMDAYWFLAHIEFFPDSVGGNSEQLLCLDVIKHWLM